MNIKVLDGATATNGKPTAGSSTVGFALDGLGSTGLGQFVPRSGMCAFVLKSTAGSGTMTITVRCWVYSTTLGEWSPLGTGTTITNRGLVNEATAITEDATDALNHAELINGLQNFNRVYFEITAIGGTGTAVDAYLIGR